MEMAEEVKYAKRTENDDFLKVSKSSLIISNKLQRLKDLKLNVVKLK